VIDIKKTAELLRATLITVENITLEEIVTDLTDVSITGDDILFTIGVGELFIDEST
jgi:hypothetical protein